MSNNTATKAKLIERIRNLLAMGGDTSSPNEAAIALKRARKLMDEHQVTMSDIEALRESDMGESGYEGASSKQETWISTMTIKIAEMNDCVARLKKVYTDGKIRAIYEFCGFKEDTQMCEFMLAYLVDTARRNYQLNRKRLGLKGLTDKNDYLLGFSEQICLRIDMLIKERMQAMSQNCKSRSLVISKETMVKQEYGDTKSHPNKNDRCRNNSAFSDGRSAAKKVHLGNFVGDSNAATGNIAP